MGDKNDQKKSWTGNKSTSSTWTGKYSNKSNTQSSYQTKGSSTFGSKAPANDLRTTGISLNNPPVETVSDLCINDHYVIAAATWSGLRVWKNVPKIIQNQTTTNTFTHKQVPFDFEEFDNILKDNKQLENHDEPIIRCTFDTLNNNILYFGNSYGEIRKVNLEVMAQEELTGYQTDMITGLKYCREKRMLASSSCDGFCYIWDPRKSPTGCAEIESKINCTNLDFVQNTIAICGIDMNTKTLNQPVVKLYDIRNLTNQLPPPPTTTSFFGSKAQTTQTTATQTKTSFSKPKQPYTEILTYPNDKANLNPFILQFSSIILDRSGHNFIAGTYGGFIISSKINSEKECEETFLVKHNTRVTSTKTYATSTSSKQKKELDGNLRYKGINCLAMVPAPIRTPKISANPIFAGLSCGSVTSLTGFRTTEASGNVKLDSIITINNDYTEPESYSITAIAVSPNGKMLVYASGDDYCEGYKYRFSSEEKPLPSKIVVKAIDTEADFKKGGRI